MSENKENETNILYDINTCAKWSSEKNLNNVHNLLIYY